MEITPIGERVLLRKPEQKEKTDAGIYIPEDAQEDKKEGIVEAVGSRDDGSSLPLKQGDKVIYGGYSSEEVEYGGEEYLLIDFEDIMAKVQD